MGGHSYGSGDPLAQSLLLTVLFPIRGSFTPGDEQGHRAGWGDNTTSASSGKTIPESFLASPYWESLLQH